MAAKWTFFYYCNAESDLFDNVITMMKNMAALNYPEEPEVNILVMVDRIKITPRMVPDRFYTAEEFEWSNTLLFVIKPGMDPIYENAEFDYGDADMGDEDYIKDFISWGIQEYPADHYGLVFYGHGTAVSIGNMMEYNSAKAILKNMVHSVKSAELFKENNFKVFKRKPGEISHLVPNDDLIIHRLQEMFPILYKASSLNIKPPKIPNTLKLSSFFGTGRNKDLYVYNIRKALLALASENNFRPDLIIFEGCFMLSYESTLELYDLTDYIIGSQGFHSRALTSNPAYLQVLLDQPGVYSPKKLSEYIIRNIEDRLQVESIEAPTIEGRKGPDLALLVPDYFFELYAEACIETSSFKEFNDSFNTMINLMGQDEPSIGIARGKCLTYYINDEVEQFNIGVIDLLSFIKHLRDATHIDSLKTAASATARFLEKAILIQKSGPRMTQNNLPWYNPTGISILYPIENASEFVGGVLVNAYMLHSNDYIFKTASNWPAFIDPKLDELFS